MNSILRRRNALGRVIAVANQKGGTAKTTTAVNLGAYLAMAGRRILLVDMDPQGNATSGFGIDKRKLKACVYNVLIEDVPLKSVMVPSGAPSTPAAPKLMVTDPRAGVGSSGTSTFMVQTFVAAWVKSRLAV